MLAERQESPQEHRSLPLSGAMMTAVSQNKNAIGYEGMGYVSKSVKALCGRRSSGTHSGRRTQRQIPSHATCFMFTNGWPEGDVLDFISYMQSPVRTEDSKQHRIRLTSGNEIDRKAGVGKFCLALRQTNLPRVNQCDKSIESIEEWCQDQTPARVHARRR